MARRWITVDGNEATASVAHRTNEVIAIYPITPSSNMGEFADEWSAKGRKNVWGTIPQVTEMQSEGGASGAVHGALQAGALTTTFTASQGLLLMIPNMYKIAGELTSYAMHVSARTVATHALSIFGDHSDVMACRQTGLALLASGSVQEAHDFACIAQAATLRARVPFLHFFDGFRTSHEVDKIEELADDDLRSDAAGRADCGPPAAGAVAGPPGAAGHGAEPRRVLPGARGVQPVLPGLPGHRAGGDGPVRGDRRAGSTGCSTTSGTRGRARDRHDGLGRRDGARDGGLAGVAGREGRRRQGAALPPVLARATSSAALPPSVRAIAVLDRTKEPGALGEPLYLDVVAALNEARSAGLSYPSHVPAIVGGRYGLSSKEFTPAMVKAVFDELAESRPKTHFTVGIIDDVTHLSLPVDPDVRHRKHAQGRRPRRVLRPGLGRHGGRQQELDQDHRRGDRQLRPGLLRLRLEEGRRGHDLAPALRARGRSGRRT